MSESLWSVRLTSGQQLDNQSTADLKALVASGKLGPEDTVYRDGLDDWVKARKLKGLFPSQKATTPQTPTAAHKRVPAQAPDEAPSAGSDGEKPSKFPQFIIGFVIFFGVSGLVILITQLHYVLGAFAAVIVIGATAVAAFAIFIKPDLLPDHLTPKAQSARNPLIAVGLAGVFGFVGAIQVPSREREAAEAAEYRVELIAQAEAAYEEGRLDYALLVANDAVYAGGSNPFDDDPNKQVARRLSEKIEREIEVQRIEDVRSQRTDLIAQAEAAQKDGRLEDALDLATAAYEVGKKSDDDPDKAVAELLSRSVKREIESKSKKVAQSLGVSIAELSEIDFFRDKKPHTVASDSSTIYSWHFDDTLKATTKGSTVHTRSVIATGTEEELTVVAPTFKVPAGDGNDQQTKASNITSMIFVASVFTYCTEVPAEVWIELLSEMMAELLQKSQKLDINPVVRIKERYIVQMHVASEQQEPWIVVGLVRKPE